MDIFLRFLPLALSIVAVCIVYRKAYSRPCPSIFCPPSEEGGKMSKDAMDLVDELENPIDRISATGYKPTIKNIGNLLCICIKQEELIDQLTKRLDTLERNQHRHPEMVEVDYNKEIDSDLKCWADRGDKAEVAARRLEMGARRLEMAVEKYNALGECDMGMIILALRDIKGGW